MFELFARHKADPDYWTAERLAVKFETKVEWVAALLQYVSPPMYAQVDGEAYGVYEIRSMHYLEAGVPPPAIAPPADADADAGAHHELK